MTKKSVTIHDIARMANVSSATVSRVLSNSSYPVSSELRSKILRIAKEEKYVPNLLGKQLKTKMNNTIGVIVPSITNSFYSTIITGVEEIARQHQYQVILCNSNQEPGLEQMYIQTMFEKQVRGLVLSSISSDNAQLSQFIEMGLKVVALDQKIDAAGVCQVDFDYRRGGYMATRHLIEQGHQRIAYVTAPLDRPSRKQVHEGYLRAMAEAALAPTVEISENAAYSSAYEFENGRTLTRKLMEPGDKPTAILACNDMTAFGVIHELQASGLHVPEEVSVMGLDGIDFGQIVHPPLSSIFLPAHEMGRLACRMLLNMINDDQHVEADIMLQPKLLQRASVAGLNRGG